ncbi:hypothetical protein GCM10017044_06420 [Kordiimonas sediminis]|uniref:ATP-binding cassette domain-containing protein n=1 Tax=Kordiimonas sediminis TaxID=1735581 RepID=A0A919E380_9PROT|nr:ABC transporter transmembrane domain-containing protein [Kordiimonas sediminis]GHF14991.1 hypothetical protein GCM10017044_06420 [Kordiimonas sediminis]
MADTSVEAPEDVPSDESDKQGRDVSDDLKNLWRHYIPLNRSSVLVSSLFINLLSLALPMMTLQVYDRIIPNSATETFTYLFIGIVVVLLLEILLKVARAWLTGWAGAKFEHQAGSHALTKLLDSKLESVEEVPAGHHLDRIAGVEAVRNFYASQASIALIDAPFVLIFLGLIAYIAGPLVVVPVVLLILAGILAIWIGRGLRDAIGDRSVWDDRRYNFIIETLGGIHTVKGLAMESLMLRRYERLMENNVDAGHRVNMLATLGQSISGFFGQLAIVLTVAFGAMMIINEELSIGGLAACTLLAGRTIQPVLRVLNLWTKYQSILVAEEKLSDLDDLPLERTSTGTRVEDVETLTLDQASFRFNDTMPMVINNASIDIKRGEMIGIQGENGSGKTALLHLLMGRLHPEEGQLLVNNSPSSEFDLDTVKRQIAYLPSQPVLMRGTILENLTFFRPKEHLNDALEIASWLGLDEIFARMPDGYETRVGEAAANTLPHGVAQRVAIARALALKPRFILFDEANSALDQAGEVYLKQVLNQLHGNTGIVLVTYRPSLLNMADRKFTLKEGELLEVTPSIQKDLSASTKAPAKTVQGAEDTQAQPTDKKGDDA